MAVHELPKLETRVRFPYPAPYCSYHFAAKTFGSRDHAFPWFEHSQFLFIYENFCILTTEPLFHGNRSWQDRHSLVAGRSAGEDHCWIEPHLFCRCD